MNHGRRLVMLLASAAAVAVPFVGDAFAHDGTISTVAGTGTAGLLGDLGLAVLADLDDPQDVAPLPDGGFLILDTAGAVVRKVDTTGTITRVAGTGATGSSGDGGPATSADLEDPRSVSATADGGFLIADRGADRVRKVASDGTVDTIAGTGTNTYDGDGVAATTASLNQPTDAVELSDGSILIADSGNHRIRMVSPGGVISTVAGTGTNGFSDNGNAVDSDIDTPLDLSPMADGGFLFVDKGNKRIRRVDAHGKIFTAAGTGSSGQLGDGGPATSASLDGPVGVTALEDGGFLIADASQHRVRRVAPDGTITTDAGTGLAGSAGDGGLPDVAELSAPADVTVSFGGGYYVADAGNHKVRFVASLDLPAVVDITPPDEPTINDRPGDVGNNTKPAWSFATEADATTKCKLKRGGTAVYGWSQCQDVRVYDLGGKVDGLYTFFVQATDAAGNVGAAATDVYALDTTPPAVPAASVSPDAHGRDATPTFEFRSDADAVATCELTRDGAVLYKSRPCPSPVEYDVSGHGPGTYTFVVKAMDAAGNQSAATVVDYTLDPPEGTAPAGRPAPAPVIGETVVAGTDDGVALVLVPGTTRYVPLSALTSVPVGSIVDARRGVARLSSALDKSGRTQSATFQGGVFEVRQSGKGGGVTDIILRGSLAGCRARKARSSVYSAKTGRPSKRRRRVWGQDSGGRWRTHGQNSVATVRGTRWLTEDTCAGTLTRVTEGAVEVKNSRTGRRVLVKAGRKYLARSARR